MKILTTIKNKVKRNDVATELKSHLDEVGLLTFIGELSIAIVGPVVVYIALILTVEFMS